MSVQGDVSEYNSLLIEIKKISERLKQLRVGKKRVEERIKSFLLSKNLPGVKVSGGGTILVEEKKRKILKKKKQQDEDAVEILKRYNISSPQRVLQELKASKMLEEVVNEKIKFTQGK